MQSAKARGRDGASRHFPSSRPKCKFWSQPHTSLEPPQRRPGGHTREEQSRRGLWPGFALSKALRFNPRSGHIRGSSNDCINNPLVFPSALGGAASSTFPGLGARGWGLLIQDGSSLAGNQGKCPTEAQGRELSSLPLSRPYCPHT